MIPLQDNKYMMCIRYVNYFIRDYGNYDVDVININRIDELDGEMNIVKQKWFDHIDENHRYSGVENIRIPNDRHSILMLFVLLVRNISRIINLDTIKLDTIESCRQSNELKCVKNWVYIDYNDSMHIIYKWYPLTLCEIDRIDNRVVQKETQ